MATSVKVSSGSDNTAVTIIQTMPTTSVVVEATLSGQFWTRTILHTQSEIALETTVLPLSDTLLTTTAPDASQTTSASNVNEKQAQSPKVPIGAVVGGLIGGAVLLTVVIVFCLCRRNRRNRQLHMRQIPLPAQVGSTYPTAFPGGHDSVHPDFSKAALHTTLRPRDPLVLANPDESTHLTKIISNALSTKKAMPGLGNGHHGESSDEKTDFADEADAISGSEITQDTSEEVRLLRVLVRAMEDRHWLSALAGDEITPTNAVVDPPPTYEETNGLLDKVGR